MAEGYPIVIPPWLEQRYDPVSTFVNAFKTGATISLEQQQLAESKRKADLSMQLQQEEMQANMLKAQAQLQVTKAYQDQQVALRQKQLDEQKAYHEQLAAKSAQDLIERQAYHDLLKQHYERQDKLATQPKVHFGPNGEILTTATDEAGNVAAKVIRQPDVTTKPGFTDQLEMRSAMEKIQQTEKALGEFKPTGKEEADKEALAMLERNAGNAKANYYFLKRKLGGGTSTKSGLRYAIEPVDESGAADEAED